MDAEVRNKSEASNEGSLPMDPEMAQTTQQSNPPTANSSTSDDASHADLVGDTHVHESKRPHTTTTHQNSFSASMENLPLSVEPDMAARLNSLGQSGIDFSRLDATDPNFD